MKLADLMFIKQSLKQPRWGELIEIKDAQDSTGLINDSIAFQEV